MMRTGWSYRVATGCAFFATSTLHASSAPLTGATGYSNNSTDAIQPFKGEAKCGVE